MSACPYNFVDRYGNKIELPTHPLRPGLPDIPPEMQHLPVDERGYPVPFFVTWIDQKPEFRASSRQAVALCIENDLCWVCGTPLKGQQVFTIGPMCIINRISSEPPAHRACARFSARACPFLSKPQMVRRESGLPDGIEEGAGISIQRNPGVIALWFSKGHEIIRFPKGMLWHFTQSPAMVEWYCEGRMAKRREVEDSIIAGLPALQAAAEQDGSIEYLPTQVAKAKKLLPKRESR